MSNSASIFSILACLVLGEIMALAGSQDNYFHEKVIRCTNSNS